MIVLGNGSRAVKNNIDVQEFVQRMQNESVDIKQLGLVGRTKDQIVRWRKFSDAVAGFLRADGKLAPIYAHRADLCSLVLLEWVVSRGDFKNLKLFRILGVYSGFFAFIGAHK